MPYVSDRILLLGIVLTLIAFLLTPIAMDVVDGTPDVVRMAHVAGHIGP